MLYWVIYALFYHNRIETCIVYIQALSAYQIGPERDPYLPVVDK